MKNLKKILFFILIFLSITNVNAEELALVENSTSAILVDYATKTILYEYNAYEELAPASMTKIASLLVVMEAIENDKLSLDTTVSISANAASMGGSQVFLSEGETYTVDELLKAVTIASGNDAVVALAEAVAGSVENFVTMMNDKCSLIGCTNTNFVNPHGLDEDNHYSSAYDMALLALELIKYENILEYTSLKEEYLTRNDGSKTWLVNTNKLLNYYVGVDGLKTGYTTNAGYCLTSTALKNDLRLITVIMNSETSETRSQDTISLLNYGFSNYSMFIIKNSDEIIDTIKVESGKVEDVNIYLEEDAVVLKNITDENKTYEIEYEIDVIKAPVNSGDVVGIASIVDEEGNFVQEINLIVKDNIKAASFIDYIKYNLKLVVNGS